MYETILFDVSDGVATITLNRPDRLNAFVPEMGDEIIDAFERVREDDAVRSVVLTGAGRGFCAGLDLEYVKNLPPEKAGRIAEGDFIKKFPLDLVAFPKPVIVAINGAAVGVGVTMSLPCDIRIAAAGAKIGITFAKLGMLPGLGSTHLLPKLVGLAKALELVLTARMLTAEEAAEIGLVNKVVPPESLLDEARAIAAMIAECPPGPIEFVKRAVHQGADLSLEEALRNEGKLGGEMREKYPRP